MWTVINFLKRFFYDLYRATVFAALEYDVRLQATKTPRQRIVIWSIILVIAAIVLSLMLRFAWYFLDTLYN